MHWGGKEKWLSLFVLSDGGVKKDAMDYQEAC
jgi:hypothetical protein